MAHQTLGVADRTRDKAVTVSCTVKLRNLDHGDNGPPGHVPGDSDWDTKAVIALIEVPGMQTRIEGHWGTASGPLYEREVYLHADWLGSPDYVLLEDVADSSPVPTDSDLYSFTATISGLRLGVALSNIGAAEAPNLWTNRRATEGWYADGYTTLEITCAGESSGVLYLVGGLMGGPPSWNAVQDDTLTPRYFGPIGQIACQATTNNGSYVQVEYRSITSDGEVMDTGDINDTFAGCIAAGSGGFDVQSGAGSGSGMYAPWRFRYDGRISKFGTTADDWARVSDQYIVPGQTYPADSSAKTPQADYITFPADNDLYTVQITSHERRNKNFGGTHSFDLDAAWMLSQDPILLSVDERIPIRVTPTLLDPADRNPYLPVEIGIDSALNVHRPDGNTPSSWVSSDVGKITVAEGASSVFTVTATGAHVTRTLVEGWRASLGNNENYRNLKHTAGDDIWAWLMYGFLRLTINVPANGTLTLVVAWVDLEVDDNHETTRAVSYTEHPYTATYQVPVTTGANVVDVDLFFPVSTTATVPCFPTRVDSLTLSGFAVGTYTLSAISLIPKSSAWVKHCIGVPRLRATGSDPIGDASALQVTVDGSAGLQAVPDTAAKPEEVGSYLPVATGGNIRYWDPLIGTGSGIVMDFQRTLEDFIDAVNQIEGLTAIFTTATEEAVLEDFYGATIGPSDAEWLLPIVPYVRMAAGTSLEPDVMPIVREWVITNSQEYRIWVDWPLWGDADVLLAQDGARGPGGVAVEAFRTDTGATVATSTTDTSGYAVISPCPANEAVIIDVRLP